MNMKRIGLWATGIGVLISVGLLTLEQGYTEEKERSTTYTLATLKGRYLFVVNGTFFPQRVG
jgi:cbb3-type cytochrome oxidase cytochrome c subunit